MSTTQKSLLLPASGKEFTLTPASIPTPGPGDVLVRNEAVALNPVDWKIQKIPYIGSNLVTFPAVIGLDFAGVVVKVGEGVTALKAGDRVLAQGKWKDNERGAYQEYTIATAQYAAKIPANISFDDAASLPLTLMTAAVGLYTKAPFGAGLHAPWEANGRGHYKGTSILVFGGGSNVGANAIQLAHLSGFSPIVTTASLTHTTRLQSLGAARVIDRHASLSDVLAGEKFAVIVDAVSTPTTGLALAAHLAPGGTLVLVLPAPEDLVLPEGGKVASVFGSPFHPGNAETGAGLYASLEKWLADGDIKTNNVEVLPGGLGGIVGGLAQLEKGEVSGVKFVVRPAETA